MIRILLLLASALTLGAQTDVMPMRFANLPACPAAQATDSTLLLRLKDPSGLGIEIWCAKEAASFNYQYRLTSADGKSKYLDRCQLLDGLSSASVDHTGPIAESKLESGGQFLRTPGRLIRFFHNNWDSQAGHHSVYNFASQQLTVYDTMALQNGIGRWIRVLTGARSYPLSAIPQAENLAALGKILPERRFEANHVNCITAPTEEDFSIHEEEVAAFIEPGKAGRLTVAWPQASAIEKIEFDAARRQLRIKFPPTARKTVVSLAFPRTMLGLGKELAHVKLDGRFIDSDETTTATHKVIRFALEEPGREATMVESGGFPFFLVSGISLVGAILIGGVIGLLFRRQLPAVPQEIDPRDREAVD
ncbi:hypothetical protein [Bryobacter aggregatus]|uniref:hypothetical protein n=1 Tax=Bryobacter aggregatus TaxID=360054 RepID=UPI0004E2527F|nr:hypothetical protein [Bryobacter aggregatus]